MKVVITGGHLAPLLAVLEAFSKKDKILIIGRKHAFEGDKALSLEYQTLRRKHLPFVSISAGRLQRIWTRYTFFSIFKFPLGFLQAVLILRHFRPNVVLSFGGYVSLPVTLAAFFLRLPVVIHEQTLEVGLANRISSLFAKKICLSWESSRKFFPKSKTVLTGNPIRKFKVGREDGEFPMIYVTGGSAGSHTINVLVEGCVKKLLEKYRVFHQTGGALKYHDFDRLQRLKKSFNKTIREKYTLTKFVNPSDIGSILQNADLVVCRSGINTITELIFLGKPSLLIPLPYSQNNEQMKNALFLKNLGLSEVLPQINLTVEKLYQKILLMMKNIKRYQKSQETKKLVKKDAAQKIFNILNVYAKI